MLINEEPLWVALGLYPQAEIFFFLPFSSKTILRVKDLAKVQTEKRPRKVPVNMYKFHVISA